MSGITFWINLFQFLMVQLKGEIIKLTFRVCSGFNSLWFNYKYYRQQNKLRFERVSIPYGSIKSIITTRFTSRLRKFQFLMVQLKALVSYVYNVGWRFQFLMVQLKVCCFVENHYQMRCFNSLWFN